LWHFLYGLQQQWQQKGGEMNNVTNDDLVLEEELTPQDLIESGREWRDLLLASMTPEERLAGMAPAERLAGMAPAERLAGMTPEEMAILQEEIARQLRQTKTSA
jgi:hypothetical protein